MKVNILSRKDQVNTQDDNKDVQMLKEELWKRRTMAEIKMLKKKQCNREDRVTEGNTTKKARGDTRAKERRWTNLER